MSFPGRRTVTVAMLGFTGDVVIQTLGTIAVAAVGAWAAIAAARRSKRAEAQLSPNGGASLADAVRRIEATVHRIDERSLLLERRVAAHDEKLEHVAEMVHRDPATRSRAGDALSRSRFT